MTDAIDDPKPGIHLDVREFEYRRWNAINQSGLWLFRRSPAHARYAFLHPDSTPATDLGSAIHAVLLEPESLEDRYAVRPPGIDRRTREGKAVWAEFIAESAGKTVLEDRDAWDTLEGIRDALRRPEHAFAHELITAPGLTEVSAVWRHEDLDVLCKGRMDRITEVGGWTWVADVKSTEDASPHAFARSVMNYGYYCQAPFYVDGLAALADRDRRFAFIAVEKKPPYCIAVYELDLVFTELGRDDYTRWLRTWKECNRTGSWPGYPDGIETLDAPAWVARRLSE